MLPSINPLGSLFRLRDILALKPRRLVARLQDFGFKVFGFGLAALAAVVDATLSFLCLDASKWLVILG